MTPVAPTAECPGPDRGPGVAALPRPSARRAAAWTGLPRIERPHYESLERRGPPTRALRYRGVERYRRESELEGACRAKPALAAPYYPAVAGECAAAPPTPAAAGARGGAGRPGGPRSTHLRAGPGCGTGHPSG